MTKPQLRVLAVLLVVGLLYFLLFVWPNATGADNPTMLSIFEPDEAAQYQHPMRMIEPGTSLRNSVRKLFLYQHYYYGFPFYLLSIGLGLLPLKLSVGVGSTTYNMLAMRQMLSVLPMILAVGVFVYAQTKFKSLLVSLALFLFLLTIPAVFKNSTWWHPDSLLLLFIALTFFFLDRDRLRFGSNFTFAGVACGLATATKLVGLFFFLAIPIYILIGLLQDRLTLWRAVNKAFLFVALMGITFVVANPFLLDPWHRQRALNIQINQAQAMASGWSVLYSKGPLAWYPMIKEIYGSILFIALGFLVLGLAICKGHRRILNILIATFVIPFTLYVLFTIVIKPTHFLLPAAIPLYSSLGALFIVLPLPKVAKQRLPWFSRNQIPALLLGAVVVLIVGFQFYHNISWDVKHYLHTINKEAHSETIQFYNELEQEHLSALPDDLPLVVFRDVRAYFPDIDPRIVHVKSRPVSYEFLESEGIELVLMWNQRALDYTNEGVLENAIDREQMEQAYILYTDIKGDNLQGFTLLYRRECCSAFLRSDLYKLYFP